jgi:hypothetical protein
MVAISAAVASVSTPRNVAPTQAQSWRATRRPRADNGQNVRGIDILATMKAYTDFGHPDGIDARPWFSLR